MRIESVGDLIALSEAELVAVVIDPQYSPAIRTAAIHWWKVLDSRRRAQARERASSIQAKKTRSGGNGHRSHRAVW
jgi:hypothetical protein